MPELLLLVPTAGGHPPERPRKPGRALVLASGAWRGLRIALTVLIAAAAVLVPGQLMAPHGARSRYRLVVEIPPIVEPQRMLAVLPEDSRRINLAQPFVAGPPPVAHPFLFAGSPVFRLRAIDCLAAATWYEAGDDPVGERAVAQVVLNRARHPAFPKTICGVVFQGMERATGCQFTFTCDGAMARTPSVTAWTRARAIATAALDGAVAPEVGYATHYHTDWVVPYWNGSLDKIAQVGSHLFYRWPGYWGTAAAFRRPLAGEEPRIAALARLSPAHGEDAPPPVAVGGQRATPVGAAPAERAPAGIAAAQLHGNTVHYAAPDERSYFLRLDPDGFAGSYATAALEICHARATCQVLGWRDAGAMAQHLPLDGAQRASLSFLYVKSAGGAEGVFWNCTQIPRALPQQCLPPGSAVDRLLLRAAP